MTSEERYEVTKKMLEGCLEERKMLVRERKISFEYIAVFDRYERYLRNDRLKHIGIEKNKWYSCSFFINKINERVKLLDQEISVLKKDLGSNDVLIGKDLKDRIRIAEATLESYENFYKKLVEFDIQDKKSALTNSKMAEFLGVPVNEKHEARYFMDKLKPHIREARKTLEDAKDNYACFRAEQYALGNSQIISSIYDPSSFMDVVMDLEEERDNYLAHCIASVMSGNLIHIEV